VYNLVTSLPLTTNAFHTNTNYYTLHCPYLCYTLNSLCTQLEVVTYHQMWTRAANVGSNFSTVVCHAVLCIENRS